MTEKTLEKYTNEELLIASKKMKSSKTIDAALIGLLIGIAAYSTFRNGFGLLTFLPLVYLPIAGKNNIKRAALEQQLKERGLK